MKCLSSSVLSGAFSVISVTCQEWVRSVDGEAPVHEGRVRVALVAVTPLLELQDHALRPDKADCGDDPVDARSAEMKVVDVRLIADDEAVGPTRLELRHRLAVQLQ